MGPAILVIDFDDDQRAYLRAALEDYGYRVFEAATAGAGFEMAERLRPDVIIGDFPMDVPGHSPFVEALRKELGSQAPILTVTGRGSIKELEAAYAVSDCVLTEPTPARLLEKVQELLARCDRPSAPVGDRP